MSLFTKVIQAVQSWRRRRGASKSRTETRVGLEQLDHRQLLTVNFTGVVATDFPATQVPGVVTILDDGTQGVQHPLIPSDLQPIVKVSGFDISGMAVSYDKQSDTLSVGLIQPNSQNNAFPVIAGDSDNNGNSGTVNPLINNPNSPPGVPGLRQNDFSDPPDMSGSKTMGAFLNFTGAATNPVDPTKTYFPANIVAGFANNGSSTANKHYEVAQAIDTGPSIPQFGTELPGNEGNVYLVNDPSRGALEFSITHFSELYQSVTGQPLTDQSVIRIGSFGSSNQDDGISEAFFPPQPFTLPPATVPPVLCPPVSPPVLINPHSARHVNTAHAESVRVTIVSSSGFDATQIDPATVRLGGAAPFTHFTRNFNHSDFPSETFVFRGYDISLPAGITPATVTGQLFDGTKFATTILIFNRNDSYYTPAQIAARDAKIGFQPPEELALEMASANANGDIATINANILAANAAAAAAAETIPSTFATFAPVAVKSLTAPITGITPAIASSSTGTMAAMTAVPITTPTAATPTTVSIPRRTGAAKQAKSSAPHARVASAMQRAGAGAGSKSTNAATSSTGSALAAHDAALSDFSG